MQKTQLEHTVLLHSAEYLRLFLGLFVCFVETGSVFTEGHRNAVRPENNVNQFFTFFSKKIIYYLNDLFLNISRIEVHFIYFA